MIFSFRTDIGNDAVKKNSTSDAKGIVEICYRLSAFVFCQALHSLTILSHSFLSLFHFAPVSKTKLPGYCGSCYGAEEHPGQCCNTCMEVKMMYRRRGWAFVSSKAIEQVWNH
jgi:hypothetical protein